jgi:hypothetical protein
VLTAFLEQRGALARKAPAILFFRARRANHRTDASQALSVRNSVSPSIASVLTRRCSKGGGYPLSQRYEQFGLVTPDPGLGTTCRGRRREGLSESRMQEICLSGEAASTTWLSIVTNQTQSMFRTISPNGTRASWIS